MAGRHDLEYRRRRAESVRKDLERHKIEGSVFSYETLESIGKLGSDGFIDQIKGPIATGKEADVFLGILGDGRIVIKIFRFSSASYFRKPSVLKYIRGDERFKRIKRSPRDLIKCWAMKEFRNLKKAQEAGIHAPKPIAIEKNVLVMQYIGDDHPAKRLLESKLKNPERTFREIVRQVKMLYMTGIVHADLSEYNILMLKDTPYLIDFGQAVLLSHPHAEEFLERDVKNICMFFQRLGVKCNIGEMLKKVRGKNG